MRHVERALPPRNQPFGAAYAAAHTAHAFQKIALNIPLHQFIEHLFAGGHAIRLTGSQWNMPAGAQPFERGLDRFTHAASVCLDTPCAGGMIA